VRLPYCVIDGTDPIPRLQFPTFGYDRITCGKKLMLQSNYSAYLMGTISLSLMSITSIKIVRIALTYAPSY
jgi:hypothetical protein